MRYPRVGGRRGRHFDGANLKPRKLLENAATPTTCPGVICRGSVATMLVIHALDKLGVPYVIGGSLASAVHGVMRATMDTDIVADLHPKHAQPLANALSGIFYADVEMIKDAIQRHYACGGRC